MKVTSLALALCTALLSHGLAQATPTSDKALVSDAAVSVADYAAAHYRQQMLTSLATLVSFNTQAVEGQTPDSNPAFVGFKGALKQLSAELGLHYEDHGYVLLISLPAARPSADGAHKPESHKLGIIAHGDVQPADPTLWAQSPYLLDTQSEPGKLIGRGTEDDKSAIVSALYAMKAIKDRGVVLDRRLELLVYLAEESDWDPLREFLKTYTPAEINITLDAEYPIVTAEKGWSEIKLSIASSDLIPETISSSEARLTHFSGGFFGSQIPGQAKAEIHGADATLLARFKEAAAKQPGMSYRFEQQGDLLTIDAEGKAVHSSTPEQGVNAVTHLAELLSLHPWSGEATLASTTQALSTQSRVTQAELTQAELTQSFVHELIGLGLEAEQFGELGYRDDFMGALTLAPTVVKQTAQGTEITLNLRRPVGKTPELLDAQAHQALSDWAKRHGATLSNIETYWGQPMLMQGAPHEQTLLDVFSHFTGIKDPAPVAIGGSTNSKLFPNALSFGPAMPGVPYTGHSEKEFITEAQFILNLKLYAAAFIELAAKGTETADAAAVSQGKAGR